MRLRCFFRALALRSCGPFYLRQVGPRANAGHAPVFLLPQTRLGSCVRAVLSFVCKAPHSAVAGRVPAMRAVWPVEPILIHIETTQTQAFCPLLVQFASPTLRAGFLRALLPSAGRATRKARTATHPIKFEQMFFFLWKSMCKSSDFSEKTVENGHFLSFF